MFERGEKERYYNKGDSKERLEVKVETVVKE
jgi:hypothetical protein